MNESTQQFLENYAPIVAIIAVFGMLWLAARRFGKTQEREGKWDAKGPLHPTDAPPGFLNPRYNPNQAPLEIESSQRPDKEIAIDATPLPIIVNARQVEGRKDRDS